MAILIAATFKGIDIYTHHGEEITVPQLKGLSYQAAKNALEKAGLRCVVEDSGYVPRLPARTVLMQSIDAGSKVKSGREVGLTLNASAPPTVVMPDIADNSSLREAESKLQALGFKLAPPEYINGEKEWVYSVKCNGRNVAAGSRISITSVITLVVGNGMTDEDFSEEDSLENMWNYGSDVNYDEDFGNSEEPLE